MDIFSYSHYMARASCMAHETNLINIYFIANLCIGIAYYLIPLMLIYILRRISVDLSRIKLTLVFFALFIFACGTGHFIDVIMIWRPMYKLQGYWDLFTACCSV